MTKKPEQGLSIDSIKRLRDIANGKIPMFHENEPPRRYKFLVSIDEWNYYLNYNRLPPDHKLEMFGFDVILLEVKDEK